LPLVFCSRSGTCSTKKRSIVLLHSHISQGVATDYCTERDVTSTRKQVEKLFRHEVDLSYIFFVTYMTVMTSLLHAKIIDKHIEKLTYSYL